MKQYDIFGNINDMKHIKELEDKTSYNSSIASVDRYFGSDLNKFVAVNCRKDMVVNNIDLIINDYKNNKIRIIESKHGREKMSKGQQILLGKLSKMGIDTYTIYGDEPYDEATIYSFQSNRTKKVNKTELIKFLNNER